MSHYFDTDKKRWRFSFNRIIGGQRIRATKLLPKGWSRAQAEKYDHDRTKALYALASGVERVEPLIGEAVALYIDKRCPVLRNGKKVIRELAFLYEYIEGRPISQVADAGREYAEDNPQLAAGTLHNRLAYLKAACRYAWKRHKLTAHDPTGHMEIPKPDNERDVRQDVSDTSAILDAIADAKARALYTLAFYTGSRWQSEIYPRKPEDVRRHGRKVELEVGTTKNGTPRLVPVHPKARWALQHLPFTERSTTWYYDRFVAARRSRGHTGMWAHDMRHVLGADVVRRTGNQRDAMEALHHSSMLSSLRYTKFATSRLEAVLFGVGTARKVHTPARRRRLRKAA